jgi:hypothetical protein
MPQFVKYPPPGPLPANTPIQNLNQLNPTEWAILTPAAQALTKGDLVELEHWAERIPGATPPSTLTIADINSLDQAYAARLNRIGAGNVHAAVACCCCCTPCCSSTAVAVSKHRPAGS